MARRTSTIISLDVQFPLPPGATNPRVVDFVKAALTHFAMTGLPENDPMGKLDPGGIEVTLKRRSTTYI